MPQRLGRQFSTLQPHPAGVGCLFRLHPVETVEAVGVRACRGRAVAPVAKRVQNDSAGGVIDPTPSIFCTCVESKVAQPSASWLSAGLLSASDCAPGCPKLRSASANQPLGPRSPAISALFSTWLCTGHVDWCRGAQPLEGTVVARASRDAHRLPPQPPPQVQHERLQAHVKRGVR